MSSSSDFETKQERTGLGPFPTVSSIGEYENEDANLPNASDLSMQRKCRWVWDPWSSVLCLLLETKMCYGRFHLAGMWGEVGVAVSWVKVQFLSVNLVVPAKQQQQRLAALLPVNPADALLSHRRCHLVFYVHFFAIKLKLNMLVPIFILFFLSICFYSALLQQWAGEYGLWDADAM